MGTKNFTLQETYKGIPICADESRVTRYHIGHTFTAYDTVEDCKEEIDHLIERRERRARRNPDAQSVFDLDLGECVITPAGKKRLLCDEDGFEYYLVDNDFICDDDEELTKIFKTFDGHIADAIETIRQGKGDALQTKRGLFGIVSDNVVRFIDRSHGEQLRKQTIEGWKNAKFTWIIKLYLHYGVGQEYIICKDGTARVSLWDYGIHDPKEFSSKEKALKFIDQLRTEIQKHDNFKTDSAAKTAWLEEQTQDTLIRPVNRALLTICQVLEKDPNSDLNCYSFGIEQWLHKEARD